MEFCSAIRKNKIVTFAVKYMYLQNIILSKVTEALKKKHPILAQMWILVLTLLFCLFNMEYLQKPIK